VETGVPLLGRGVVRERLQASARAAVAPRASDPDPGVLELAGVAVGAAVHPAAKHGLQSDAVAKPGYEYEYEEFVVVPPGAVQQFSGRAGRASGSLSRRTRSYVSAPGVTIRRPRSAFGRTR
jgi:hypothetical protein